MSALTEFAPAKINLHLHVVGRRADGYHLLHSLVAFAGIGDRLSASPAAGLSLAVTGPFAAELAGEADNLVLRAAHALAAQAGIAATGRLVLEKNLPVASGIGGGSADAAATLRLLCRLWGVKTPVLDQIGAALGADVPVCLASRPAVMSGIGEVLAVAPVLPDVGIVLLNPRVAVSTPAVFGARAGVWSKPAALPSAGWTDVDAMVTTLRGAGNDLESPAIRLAPVIGEALAALSAAPGCLMARMSGSGATCFGLFATPNAARAASRTVARDGWWAWGGGFEPLDRGAIASG